MANSLSMALIELLRKAETEPDLDTRREGVRELTQRLSAQICAVRASSSVMHAFAL